MPAMFPPTSETMHRLLKRYAVLYLSSNQQLKIATPIMSISIAMINAATNADSITLSILLTSVSISSCSLFYIAYRCGFVK